MFLPFASPGANNGFMDLYYDLGNWIGRGLLGTASSIIVIGALMTAILHPITIALAFLSIVKPRLTRVAGILGIVSCAGIIVAVSDLIAHNPGLEYGIGIWVGLAGAIILLISGYISKKIGGAVTQSRPLPPPPPPPPQVAQTCPTCGGPLTFIQQYSRWSCYNCHKYL
jgi:hypothetical protein